MTCHAPCIAAVNGRCAVTDCRGPIRTSIPPVSPTPEAAAALYDLSLQIFADSFRKRGSP